MTLTKQPDIDAEALVGAVKYKRTPLKTYIPEETRKYFDARIQDENEGL